MKFKLIEKTQKEIDNIINYRKDFSKSCKIPNREVCPLTLILANNKQIEAWELTEQQIINLVNANVKEMTENGPSDKVGTDNSFKVLNCWKEKYTTVSADFVEMFYKMKNTYTKGQKEMVRDMLTPLIVGTIEPAEKIAKFEKGRKNDFSKVSEAEIVKIIREQERQLEAEKEYNKNQQV